MSIYIGNKKSTLVKGSGKPAQFFKGNTKISGFNNQDFLILPSQGKTEISGTYSEPLCAQIYGESTAVGDSFPKNIVSAQNPVITVMSSAVTVPYTLRSIGNDCDSITVSDGKVLLTQNIAAVESLKYFSSETEQYHIRISSVPAKEYAWNSGKYISPSCSLGAVAYEVSYEPTVRLHWYGCYTSESSKVEAILVAPSGYTLKSYFEKIGYSDPITFQYVMETPQVTDISETETGQALLSLQTAFPKTDISISCGKLNITAKIAD